MALIKCPECGEAVSSKAKACVHCGCPLDAPGWEEARDDGLCRVVIEEAGSMPLFLLIHFFDEKCSSGFGPIGASGGRGGNGFDPSAHARPPVHGLRGVEAGGGRAR